MDRPKQTRFRMVFCWLAPLGLALAPQEGTPAKITANVTANSGVGDFCPEGTTRRHGLQRLAAERQLPWRYYRCAFFC